MFLDAGNRNSYSPNSSGTKWKTSEAERINVLFFLVDDINIDELIKSAYNIGVLIDIQNSGNGVNKIIFKDILN